VPGWRGGSQSSATLLRISLTSCFINASLHFCPAFVCATVAADENALSQKLGMCTAYSVGDKREKERLISSSPRGSQQKAEIFATVDMRVRLGKFSIPKANKLGY